MLQMNPPLIRIMCRDCILVLFLPLYLNLYTDIQIKLPLTKALLTNTDNIKI